jgi:hypothetical protein
MLYSSDIRRFWEKVDIKGEQDCWPWLANKYHNGYGQFKLCYTTVGAHRIAYEIAYGPIPDGMEVLHKCDNRPCCNPNHLYLGTQTDNNSDRAERNPANQGGTGCKPSLYAGEIWLIRKLLKEGKGIVTQTKIAKMFKVCPMTITNILKKDKFFCKEGYYI